MKMLIPSLFAVFLVIGNSFAQNIDQKLLTGKRWYLCRAENADGSTIKNRKPCEIDNYYVFLPDKTYSLFSGENKCDTGEPDVIKKGKWSIENWNLSIDDVDFDLGYYNGSPQISGDKMVLLDIRKALWVTLTYGADPVKYGYTKEDSPDDIIVNGTIILYANSNCDLGNRARKYLKDNQFTVDDRCIDKTSFDDEMYGVLRKDGWIKGEIIQMPVMIINGITYWRDRPADKFLERLKHGTTSATTTTSSGKTSGGGLDAKDITHSREDIIAKWKQGKPLFSDFKKLIPESPVLAAPYALGSCNIKYFEDALKMLNFVRYVAGLPDDLEMDETLNKRAQAVTLVNTVNGGNSHSPVRPEGMGDDLYLPAKEDAIKCNLRIEFSSGSYRSGSMDVPLGYTFHLLSSIIGYAADNDPRNVTKVAHRRNMLRPQLKKTGFGYIESIESSVEGDWTKYSSTQFSSNHVGDKSRAGELDYDFIMWPPKGYFPTVFFNDNQTGCELYPWSVAINSKKHKIPVPQNITVEVVRKSDQMKWVINKSNYTEEDYYGEKNSILRVHKGNAYWPETIVFNLDLKATYNAGDQYSVSITGVKDLAGKDVSINYVVEFFDLPCTLHEYPWMDLQPVKETGKKDDRKQDNITKETKKSVTEENQSVIKMVKSLPAVATSDGYFMIKNKKAYFTDDSGEKPAFIDIVEGYVEQTKPGELYCEIVLANIPDKLTFNHKKLDADNTEYDWSLYFDVDGDGVNDYNIGAYYAKSEGSKEIQSSWSDGVANGIWKWNGESWVTAEGIDVKVTQSGNSIIFSVTNLPKSFTLNNESKFFARSFYFMNDSSDQAP